MLEVKGLCAGYDGSPVVRDVELSVAEGEVVALLGPNGAGKSTTLGAIAGLVRTFSGSVELDGVDLTRRPAHLVTRHKVALVPEKRSLIPSLTVGENLRIVHRQALDPLPWFPALIPILKRKAGLLSGGEQQMVAIARGISSAPRLLMVDELSLGLAPVIVKDLTARLSAFARDTGGAVLLVEQHVAQALAIAQRAYVLTHGDISTSHSSQELMNSRSVVEASYLGEGRPVDEVDLHPQPATSTAGTNRGSAE